MVTLYLYIVLNYLQLHCYFVCVWGKCHQSRAYCNLFATVYNFWLLSVDMWQWSKLTGVTVWLFRLPQGVGASGRDKCVGGAEGKGGMGRREGERKRKAEGKEIENERKGRKRKQN